MMTMTMTMIINRPSIFILLSCALVPLCFSAHHMSFPSDFDNNTPDSCNPQKLTPKHYTVKKCIVTRDYVSVLLGNHIDDPNHPCNDSAHQVCVIKILDKRKLLQKHGRVQRAEFEALSLSKIVNHDHVVKFLHTMQDEYYGYLVTEFLDAMTLEKFYEKTALTEPQVKFIVGELVLAVEAVHDIMFIHRDVKPDNIMLTRQGHVKLIDFGFAVPFGQHESVVRSGTPFYAASEYLEQKSYNQSVDWFALGMTCLQMVNRAGIIKKLTAAEINAAKSMNELPSILIASEDHFEPCVDFLKLILGDGDSRPHDAVTLKKHAWLADGKFGLQHSSPLDMTIFLSPPSSSSSLVSHRTRTLSSEEKELMQDFPMFHFDTPSRGIPISTRSSNSNKSGSKQTNVVELRYY